MKDFETRRVAEQNEIDELELQCVVVREQVKNTAATLGGCYAVTTNDRQVAQLTEIMERRVLKAQARAPRARARASVAVRCVRLQRGTAAHTAMATGIEHEGDCTLPVLAC